MTLNSDHCNSIVSTLNAQHGIKDLFQRQKSFTFLELIVPTNIV